MNDLFSGVPTEDCRGIENSDTNDEALIILSPIDEIAYACTTLYPNSHWLQNIHQSEIAAPSCGILIFQCLGHLWTVVHSIHSSPPHAFASLGYQEARSLSHLLQTKSISYSISDTSGCVQYQLFENGQLLEWFSYPPDVVATNESKGKDTENLQFPDNKAAKKNVADPVVFVDLFLRSQDAYIPDMSGLWCKEFQTGERVAWAEEVGKNLKLKRMDCLILEI